MVQLLPGVNSIFCVFRTCTLYTVKKKYSSRLLYMYIIVVVLLFVFLSHISRTQAVSPISLVARSRSVRSIRLASELAHLVLTVGSTHLAALGVVVAVSTSPHGGAKLQQPSPREPVKLDKQVQRQRREMGPAS